MAETCGRLSAAVNQRGIDKGFDGTQPSRGQLDVKHALPRQGITDFEILIYYMDLQFRHKYSLRIQEILQSDTDNRSNYEKRAKLIYWSMIYSLILEDETKYKNEHLDFKTFCQFVDVNRSSLNTENYGGSLGLSEKKLESLMNNPFYGVKKINLLKHIREVLKSDFFENDNA